MNAVRAVSCRSWIGHPAGIFLVECGCTDSHINDGFIDQHLFTADQAAIQVFLRRRAKEFVQALVWERLVALATHTSLSVLLPAHHRTRHRWGARYATPPCRGDSADRVRGPDPCSVDTVDGRSSGR